MMISNSGLARDCLNWIFPMTKNEELRSGGPKFKIEMRKAAFFFSGGICLEDPVRHGRAKPSTN